MPSSTITDNPLVKKAEEQALPNYRPAAGQSSRCGTCKNFQNETCVKFGVAVDPSYVCDDWEQLKLSLPTIDLPAAPSPDEFSKLAQPDLGQGLTQSSGTGGQPAFGSTVRRAPLTVQNMRLPAARPLLPKQPPHQQLVDPVKLAVLATTGNVLPSPPPPPPPASPATQPPPGSFRPSPILALLTTDPNDVRTQWQAGIAQKTVPQVQGPSVQQLRIQKRAGETCSVMDSRQDRSFLAVGFANGWLGRSELFHHRLSSQPSEKSAGSVSPTKLAAVPIGNLVGTGHTISPRMAKNEQFQRPVRPSVRRKNTKMPSERSDNVPAKIAASLLKEAVFARYTGGFHPIYGRYMPVGPGYPQQSQRRQGPPMSPYGLPQLGHGATDVETLDAQYEQHRKALVDYGIRNGFNPQAVEKQLQALTQRHQQNRQRLEAFGKLLGQPGQAGQSVPSGQPGQPGQAGQDNGQYGAAAKKYMADRETLKSYDTQSQAFDAEIKKLTVTPEQRQELLNKEIETWRRDSGGQPGVQPNEAQLATLNQRVDKQLQGNEAQLAKLKDQRNTLEQYRATLNQQIEQKATADPTYGQVHRIYGPALDARQQIEVLRRHSPVPGIDPPDVRRLEGELEKHYQAIQQFAQNPAQYVAQHRSELAMPGSGQSGAGQVGQPFTPGKGITGDVTGRPGLVAGQGPTPTQPETTQTEKTPQDELKETLAKIDSFGNSPEVTARQRQATIAGYQRRYPGQQFADSGAAPATATAQPSPTPVTVPTQTAAASTQTSPSPDQTAARPQGQAQSTQATNVFPSHPGVPLHPTLGPLGNNGLPIYGNSFGQPPRVAPTDLARANALSPGLRDQYLTSGLSRVMNPGMSGGLSTGLSPGTMQAMHAAPATQTFSGFGPAGKSQGQGYPPVNTLDAASRYANQANPFTGTHLENSYAQQAGVSATRPGQAVPGSGASGRPAATPGVASAPKPPLSFGMPKEGGDLATRAAALSFAKLAAGYPVLGQNFAMPGSAGQGGSQLPIPAGYPMGGVPARAAGQALGHSQARDWRQQAVERVNELEGRWRLTGDPVAKMQLQQLMARLTQQFDDPGDGVANQRAQQPAVSSYDALQYQQLQQQLQQGEAELEKKLQELDAAQKTNSPELVEKLKELDVLKAKQNALMGEWAAERAALQQAEATWNPYQGQDASPVGSLLSGLGSGMQMLGHNTIGVGGSYSKLRNARQSVANFLAAHLPRSVSDKPLWARDKPYETTAGASQGAYWLGQNLTSAEERLKAHLGRQTSPLESEIAKLRKAQADKVVADRQRLRDEWLAKKQQLEQQRRSLTLANPQISRFGTAYDSVLAAQKALASNPNDPTARFQLGLGAQGLGQVLTQPASQLPLPAVSGVPGVPGMSTTMPTPTPPTPGTPGTPPRQPEAIPEMPKPPAEKPSAARLDHDALSRLAAGMASGLPVKRASLVPLVVVSTALQDKVRREHQEGNRRSRRRGKADVADEADPSMAEIDKLLADLRPRRRRPRVRPADAARLALR